MKVLYFIRAILLVVSTIFVNCAGSNKPKVIQRVLPPPIETNCYLMYDDKSGEAALVDVGGQIDTLTAFIEKNHLKIKYIFITHCHPDHVFGLPAIKELFPEAKICISRADFEDTKLYSQWESKMSPEMVAEIKKSPEAVAFMNFDISKFCQPDIFLENNQTYKVGNIDVRTIFSPGHSRGSVCYWAGNVLFSGDVLSYKSVGRTDLVGGERDSLVTSVRRLYSMLPEETIVYPGHRQFTDIGFEKKNNLKISEDSINIPN